MRDGLAKHCGYSGEVLKYFDLPHVSSGRSVNAVARPVTIYALDHGAKDELEHVAAHILTYEKDFYDSMV